MPAGPLTDVLRRYKAGELDFDAMVSSIKGIGLHPPARYAHADPNPLVQETVIDAHPPGAEQGTWDEIDTNSRLYRLLTRKELARLAEALRNGTVAKAEQMCCEKGLTAAEHRAQTSDHRCCSDDPPTADTRTPSVKGAAGDCYPVALHGAMDPPEDLTNVKLVHATVLGRGQLDGKRFGHAWIEGDKTVEGRSIRVAVDKANGKDVELPADAYRQLGKAERVTEYDVDDAMTKAAGARHYGPWK